MGKALCFQGWYWLKFNNSGLEPHVTMETVKNVSNIKIKIKVKLPIPRRSLDKAWQRGLFTFLILNRFHFQYFCWKKLQR